MDTQEFADRLNERLDVEAYAGTDASANGLQIGPDDRVVDRAAFAVDGAVETIERAADRDADVLVVHHGISWGGIERVTGRQYDRISAAIDNDVALYAAHLPLDGHQELGNAAGIADLLGLSDREPFGTHGGEYIGQRGRFSESKPLSEITEMLSAELDTADQEVRALEFGPSEIRDVAVVTGSGVDWLDEALDVGADLLLTGEGKQNVYHEARESGINVVLGGHYATETFGVRALRNLVADWDIETAFIDHPTGL
ncbi:Nif3-like dinuclear metal center hexameric protein [Halovenus sp. WSH3]|uniref:Nif3-like dinuclear metal center hexameric protein n=1 Tax=Halovenus carboxidivorans TaxID=2692199 RepID=A0A6B0T718_9EURY|nr:Nif3-like dinuclear metal center hexameric protein [Halovenus carboxidivorans]MXR51082.1 Nif3-like dinuclear metal center hexameric protein [Halovenus carboxidivorans]